MGEGEDREHKKRIDLSMSQVVGGGLATLTAATAASYLGVYGTIIGAAVMSVMSTAGTAVIQHFVQQGGDRAKDIAERAKVLPGEHGRDRGAAASDPTRHEPGPVTDGTATQAAAPTSGAGPAREPEDTPATRMFPAAPAPGEDETAVLGAVPGGHQDPPRDAEPTDATRTTPAATPPRSPRDSAGPGAANASGDERSWWRRWRAVLIPALVIFGMVMLAILVFELFTGRSMTDTVHGNDTRSGPTLLGGHPDEQYQEEPADDPDAATRESEGPRDDAPDPGAPEPGAPGEEPDQPGQPGQDPGTGETGEPGGGQAPAPGDGGDGGQQDAPDPGTGQQDGTDQGDTGDDGAPPSGGSYDQPS